MSILATGDGGPPVLQRQRSNTPIELTEAASSLSSALPYGMPGTSTGRPTSQQVAVRMPAALACALGCDARHACPNGCSPGVGGSESRGGTSLSGGGPSLTVETTPPVRAGARCLRHGRRLQLRAAGRRGGEDEHARGDRHRQWRGCSRRLDHHAHAMGDTSCTVDGGRRLGMRRASPNRPLSTFHFPSFLSTSVLPRTQTSSPMAPRRLLQPSIVMPKQHDASRLRVQSLSPTFRQVESGKWKMEMENRGGGYSDVLARRLQVALGGPDRVVSSAASSRAMVRASLPPEGLRSALSAFRPPFSFFISIFIFHFEPLEPNLLSLGTRWRGQPSTVVASWRPTTSTWESFLDSMQK